MPLEGWIFGAIMVLVGVLVVTCGFTDIEYCIFFRAGGTGLASIGFCTFAIKFREWIHNL
jgi:hypothetical protein